MSQGSSWAHTPGLDLEQLHPRLLRIQGSRGKKAREQPGSTARRHQAGCLYPITHSEHHGWQKAEVNETVMGQDLVLEFQ
jgi:hypothetical protein